MLVLTRRPGQSIRIAGDISVTIISVKGTTVCVGVKAPPQVTVDREEVHQRKLQETRSRQHPDRT